MPTEDRYVVSLTGEQVDDALQQMNQRIPEGWAVGTRDGVPVPSTSPFYHNNAKYWAEQAQVQSGVTSFNGRSGAVTPQRGDYNASMVGALPASTVVPTKTSDLVNDSGFISGDLSTFRVYAGQASGTVGTNATAEGSQNNASGSAAHAEGYSTTASGLYSHAEGNSTTASATSTHAEGGGTNATANYAHSEGDGTSASGGASHAEGTQTEASGKSSHAEGQNTIANGGTGITSGGAHAEGQYTRALGIASHAEGGATTAEGDASHAEGLNSNANGRASHAEGGTTANKAYQHTFGRANVAEEFTSASDIGTYIEIVGNGSSSSSPSNARTLDWSGNEVLAGKLTVGASPTAAMDVATKQYVDTAISGAISGSY